MDGFNAELFLSHVEGVALANNLGEDFCEKLPKDLRADFLSLLRKEGMFDLDTSSSDDEFEHF